MGPCESILDVHGVLLQLNLGWPEEERSQPQAVSVDFAIGFPTPPQACSSDDLAHTHCYATAIKKIRKHCEGRSFRLVEFLAKEIHDVLAEDIETHHRIWVKVTKVHPPVQDMTGGLSFSYGKDPRTP